MRDELFESRLVLNFLYSSYLISCLRTLIIVRFSVFNSSSRSKIPVLPRTGSMFEWLVDFEEFFSCARLVVVAMMRVDGITNNVVPEDNIAFIPQ